MKIAITAFVQNGQGKRVPCVAVVDGHMVWIPMNAGDGPLEADKRPNHVLEIEMHNEDGWFRQPTMPGRLGFSEEPEAA